MLRSLKELKGDKLRATDGELGDVRDFYFDDVSWQIRYLVAYTSRWLSGRRVLLSPAVLGEPARGERTIPVALTKDQIRHAPDVDTERPISRQHEIDLARHYAWPEYWGVGGPVVPPVPPELRPPEATRTGHDDPHLRSLGEVVGYDCVASGTRIGKVDDLIAETLDWSVRYFVVDTKLWRPGGEVLLAPHWVERIDWAEHALFTDLSEGSLRACPLYDPSLGVDRALEDELHTFLGRPRAWR